MQGETINVPSSSVPYTFEHSKHLKSKILKPIRQEKVVKVPVTQYVEKIVEKEEIKYVNKYVDVIKPIITYKTKHISKPIYLDKIKYQPKVVEKEKIIHIPKIEYRNKIVEIPVYVHKENIIEKKVPLIVERVVPVLKVNRVEKEILTNSFEIPEICEMTKDENNIHIGKNVHETNQQISCNVSEKGNSFVSEINKEKSDIYNIETYRHMQTTNASPKVYSQLEISSSNMDNQNVETLKDKNNVVDSNDTSDEEEYNEGNLEHKNETRYHEATNEYSNYDFTSEKNQKINDEENNSKELINNNNMEENYYDIDERFKDSNISHVSIHLPEEKGIEQQSYEQNYMNSCNNNYNIIESNLGDTSGSVYNNINTYGTYYSDNMNPQFDKTFVNQSYNGSKGYIQKIMQRNHIPNYSTNTMEHLKIVEEKHPNSSNLHISNEKFSTLPSVYGARSVTGKSNFVPSYANSNGQAIVSVRPATIVEYVPKSKKYKASLCNFINKCCGNM